MQPKNIPLLCRGHSRPVVDFSYSPITPDGFFLISACLDGKPQLRAGETGDWIGTFMGHKGAVWSARLNSTATRALTASADYTAKFWDSITGDELLSLNHGRIVKSVAFSHDNNRALTGGSEKLLRVFDLETTTNSAINPTITMDGHTQSIKVALWPSISSPDIIVSGGDDSHIRVWDLRASPYLVKSIATKAPITSIELTYNQKYLLSTAGNEVSFWNPTTFQLEHTFTTSVESRSASLHPDGSRFITGGADFYVRVFNFPDGAELELHKGHHGPVHCVKYAPDGHTYASGSEDGTIRLWQNVVTSYQLWQLGSVTPPPASNTTLTPPLPVTPPPTSAPTDHSV